MGGKITVVGLGPGDPGMLSSAALELLGKSRCIRLRTGIHPVVEWLGQRGIHFDTFDYIYREAGDFQEVYRRIADEVIELGRKGDVTYAVPGHPMVAEESVELIINSARGEGLEVGFIPGMSFLDALYAVLEINPARGLHIIDGLRMGEQRPDPAVGTVVTQAYSRLVLSDIKISLMETYPDDHPVTIVTAAGVPGEESIERCLLYELDRTSRVNHLTSVYIPPLEGETSPAGCRFPLDPLVDVMARLRGEGGCPWDREQDHLSLRPYLLEEAYEVIDALDRQDMYNICEELGDLLLQIVFHALIAGEGGHFGINDVVGAITEKMVRRHPHVFGSVKVENSREVLENWAAIKKKEKGKGAPASIMDDLPRSLPSLIRAQKIQARAARVGFDWPSYEGALEKLYEELSEIKEAVKSGSGSQMEEELGDVLFSVLNLSRILNIDAEIALSRTISKFLDRFGYIEERAAKSGLELDQCSLEQMDNWWEEVKKQKKV
ncbi:MAG TPA: nucleoside triphosphate pyrophosphohydrolase [Desulfotomaculum sp.]|nr:nucleoside triphosphate pyrophosphohydrolase [Desulfotomaculum sp.]